MFKFKTRLNLTINNKDVEAITLINILYWPQCGEIKLFDTFLNSVFSQTKSSNNLTKALLI